LKSGVQSIINSKYLLKMVGFTCVRRLGLYSYSMSPNCLLLAHAFSKVGLRVLESCTQRVNDDALFNAKGIRPS